MTKRLRVGADHASKKFRDGVVRVRQTLWQWAIVAPQVLPAVTSVIIASLVVSGLGRIFIISWLETGLGYLWTKEANIRAASVWKRRRWVRSLVALLIYSRWLLALTSRDILYCQGLCVSGLTEKYMFMELCLKSCNTSYVSSKRPHLPPVLPTHRPIKTSRDFTFGAAVRETALKIYLWSGFKSIKSNLIPASNLLIESYSFQMYSDQTTF